MLKFGVIVLLITVYLPSSVAKTCTVCKGEYDTAKTAAATDNKAKCSALAKYLTCLEGSGKSDAGCPPDKTDAELIETDFTGASCGTAFTDTCKCQKDFWKTDQKTGGDAAVCSASKTYVACLKGKTNRACDNATTAVNLATGVETRITGLGSKACAVTTACQCEIDATKADISTDDKTCTALTDLKTCLSKITDKAEEGCIGTTQANLVTDTDKKITDAKCGNFADHVTYTMTSLIIPFLVHLFM